MRSTWSLLCLGAVGALLILSTDVTSGPAGVNCRRFVYHPVCRGVAAKRSDLPVSHRHLHQDDDRKQEDEGPDAEYIPVPVTLDVTGEAPRRALWSILADRPTNVLLAHRKLEPETLELYDYE